jgi:hypothetical protein
MLSVFGSPSHVVGGIAIGVPTILAATRLMTAMLFGVTPSDPTTIASAALLMPSCRR